jgi:hypothetical protein
MTKPAAAIARAMDVVFRRLLDSVSDIEFRAVNGIVVDMENFPQDKATFDTKYNTTISDQRQGHILLVVETRSFKTFYALKQFVWNLLNKRTVFMEQHTLGLLWMVLLHQPYLPQQTTHQGRHLSSLHSRSRRLLGRNQATPSRQLS